MQLPTIKLRHKATGQIRIVNQTKFSANLGGWGDFEIVSMRGGTASDRDVMIQRRQEEIEVIRENNPKSPAYGDKQRAYEGRAIVAPSLTAVVSEDFTSSFTTAVVPVEEAPPIPAPEARVVPTIGGTQTVKMRGRPKRGGAGAPETPPVEDEGSPI
jgi:hypothetical protein